MKKIGLFIITAAISLGTCFSAFAGQWKQDAKGWWYANGDSTYANDGWTWIDGKCYYFTPQGYCLQGTTTPDGYQVDGSGAWIIDGVVQTQDPQKGSQSTGSQQTGNQPAAALASNHYQLGNLKFTSPLGFALFEQTSDTIGFVSFSPAVIMGVNVQALEAGTGDLMNYLGGYVETIIDYSIIDSFGQYHAKTQKSFPTGNWLRYDFSSIPNEPEPGTMVLYARVSGDEMQMILFMGETGAVDTDGYMSTGVYH